MGLPLFALNGELIVAIRQAIARRAMGHRTFNPPRDWERTLVMAVSGPSIARAFLQRLASSLASTRRVTRISS